MVDGIRHYVVDHTPSLFYKTTTNSLSKEFVKYIDILIEDAAASNEVLQRCFIMDQGVIVDEKIKKFQHR